MRQRANTVQSVLILLLCTFMAALSHAQVDIKGSTVVTGGGNTGNNLATYSHPGNVAGGVCFVSPYTISSDAFAAINACLAELPAAGGTIDATALGTANYTVTTPLTALNTAGAKVTLLKNPATTFTLNQVFSSPTNTPASCAVPVGEGSAVVDVGGVGVNQPNFLVGNLFVGQDVVCNGDFSGAQDNMRIEGVNVQGNSAATVQGALMHFQGLFNGTPSVENSSTSQCSAQCLELDSSTTSAGQGNLLFINDQFTDGATSGTYPGSVVGIDALTVAGGLGNITFVGGSIKFNGPHNSLLKINGRGGAQTNTITFLNTGFVTAAATSSGANPNVDPIQITDAAQIYFSSLNIEGFTNSAAQANALDISATVPNQSFGISIGSMRVFTSAGFTRMINNTVEGTSETGFANGAGDTILPPYSYGQVVPQIRQTNVAPPTSVGVCTIGNLWTNSSAASASTTVSVCAGAPGLQTYQPLGSGGGGGAGTVNNALANQLGEYPAAGDTIGGGPGLFALTPTMTQAQINSLLSGLSGSNTYFIPNGMPQVGYTNPAGQVPHSFRLSDDWFQMPGVACDGRQTQLNIPLTAGSNQSNVGATLTPADVGKTFFFFSRSGYALGSTQSVWTAKLQSYTFPFATWSANAPFNFNNQVEYGTDNLPAITLAMTQASSSFPLTIPTGCLLLVNGTIQWNNNQVIAGRHQRAGGFIGRPAADVISTVDSAGNTVSAVGTGIKGFSITPGTEVDWTLGYNLYAADGTLTVVPPVYRPIYDHTSLAPNPLAPGSLTGGKNGVASITQNSAVICTPNAETPPAVGQQIMFPYFANIFTSTVSSTAGSCAGGFTARTMAAAFPNTSTYTLAQAEWFTGSAIQSTTTTIPTTITYPLTLTMTLSVDPVPGWISNWPQTGTLKVCGVEMEYGGASGTTVVARRGPATSAGCAGTTPVAQVNECRAKNLLGSGSDQPWPVTPSINAGDSTPSGANWFPGGCVGNAAIAFPTANGNTYVGAGLVGGFISDIDFVGSAAPNTNSGNANNVADIYMAGDAQLFSSRIENIVSSNTNYCMVQGPASAGQHGVAAVGPTGIGNTIRNYWCFAGQPMAFVDMQSTDITNLNMNSAEISPFDGTAVGSSTCLQEGYTLDERTGGVVTSTQYLSHRGYACEGENGSHAWVKPVVDIQSSHNSFEAANFEAIPNVFGGDHLKITNSTLHLPAIDYGTDNAFGALDGSNSGYITNIWDPAHPAFIEWGRNAQCSMFLGGSGPEQACGASLVQGYKGRDLTPSVTGNSAYYPNGGMITPWMWDSNGSFDTNPFTKSGTPDTTAKFWGASSQCALGGGALCHTQHFAQDVNGFLYMGPFNQLYDGPYVLDATFKSAAAPSSFLLTIRANDSGSGQCASGGSTTLFAGTVTTTTSYSPFKTTVDMTGHQGCTLDVTYSGGSTTDTILTDRFNFVPQPGQVLLPVATPTVGAACAGPAAIIGSNSSSPLYCLNNLVVAGAGGSSGITQLTADVVAGPGSGSVAATVARIGGGTVLNTFTGLLQNTAGAVSQATSVSVSGVVQSGTRLVSAVNAVAFSATPVIDLSLGNTQLITLTGNVSSSTVTNPPATGSTQRVDFIICQDGTGGRTWTWPTAFQGVTPTTLTASGCTSEFFNVTTTAAGTTYLADNYNSAFGNSSANPSLAGQAYRGYFSIPTGTNPTAVVDTTAVGAQSVILLQFDESIGLAMSPTVTCNTTPLPPVITAKAVGVSFTAGVTGTVSTNPVCVAFTVVNP